MVVFGGQSDKGSFCKPLVHQFQLPDWVLKHKPWRARKAPAAEANFGFKSRSALAAAAGEAVLSVAGSGKTGGTDEASTPDAAAAGARYYNSGDCPLAQLRAKTAKFHELLGYVEAEKAQLIERLTDECRLTVSYTEVSATAGRSSAAFEPGMFQARPSV